MSYRVWMAVFCLLLAKGESLVSADDLFDDLRTRIPTILVDEQVPSVAVAVARDGQIVWEQGFGWADRENRRPADEHTMYSLASISKPITATGLMVLVERQALQLDQPANRYLGEAKLTAFVGDAQQATLRRLANHTSGLPLHYQFFYADEAHRRPPMDDTIRRYGILVNAPGETYRYANLGYGILDYVLTRASGKPYASFMREEVFLPLGLTHTSVDIGPGLEAYAAVRYDSQQNPLPFYDFDHPGASAVYSSAHDLVRFGMFHLGQRLPDQKAILTAESIEEMQRGTATIGPDAAYGIGWSINGRDYGAPAVTHGGGMGGVRTHLVLLPSLRAAVVVLSNSSNELVTRLAKEIAGLLPRSAAKEPATEAPVDIQADKPPLAQPEVSFRGRWEGQVRTDGRLLPISLEFQDDGDIHVRLNGQLKTLVNEARQENGYLLGVFAGDIGTVDANRRPYHLHLNVKLRGDILGGSLTAISLPAPKFGNALSHWVELRQAQPPQAGKP
ncbi:MAG: serine hydrolase domain-containing protein [Pirellulales bacterium]